MAGTPDLKHVYFINILTYLIDNDPAFMVNNLASTQPDYQDPSTKLASE
jgi:hypothetical protein